jgi:hypothetical protein
MSETWRRCSACKNDIPLGGLHYVCSVSTCNRKRTGLVFCSVDCWEIHLPTERHREAWAVEARAPATPEPAASSSTRPSSPPGTRRDRAPSKEAGPTASSAPKAIVRRRRAEAPTGPAPATAPSSNDGEILVVASKLKQYVRDTSGFNTSDRVLPVLSAALRRICDEAIENARRAERLTVLDRDVPRG